MPKRETYADNLKWNITDIYPNIDAFKKDYVKLEQTLPEFKKWENHLLDSAQSLYDFLELDTDFSKVLEQILTYAHLLNDQDTTDTFNQTLYGQACNLYEAYQQATSYVGPEILKSDYQVIEKFIQEDKRLKKYERILKELFKVKPYTLSEREEKLLSSISSAFRTPDEVFSYLTDADLRFAKITNEEGKKEELTEKNYRQFIESTNRQVRKNAFKTLYKTYSNFKNTYASLLAAEVKKNNKIAKVRGYESALQASLFGNDIPVSIYTNLITTVKKNIDPLSNYWHLKQVCLKVPKLHLYDTYAPITKESTKKYSIYDAENLILNSLKVLGPTYINDLKKAFTEKWIDFCSNDGKRNGAYCTACYNVHPYVLLSFDGSLNNVSTLIHELGHAMHYYYAIKNQSFVDYNYSIFVAEVASQVNQILLSKYLIDQTNDLEEKKYLIDDLIGDFKATIYRQTMFAEFEKEIHELDQKGQILTCEVLNDLYYKLNQAYFGQNIVLDPEIKYEWMRIPHFYMDFYVYQYATAYAASIIIAMNILNGKEEAQENYLRFLKLGATLDPIASLKVAGVDMTDAKVLEEAFKYFNSLVMELTNLTK